MSGLHLDVRQAARGLFVAGAALALANIVGWFVFTRPVVRSYTDLLREQEQYEKIDERRDQVGERAEYLAALQQAEEDLRFLHDEVLSTRSARMIEVQQEMNELTERFDIKNATAVNYDTEMLLSEGLDRFVTEVSLEGNYISLRRFLEAVEDSSEFLLVERVILNKGKEGSVALDLGITLATYFNAPEELVKRQRELERSKRRGQT